MSILNGRRSQVVAGVVLSAIAIVMFLPQASSAAVSGGWRNLGHGATATSAPLDSQVHAIAQAGSLLYFGGDFTDAGGIAAADGVAAWNGTTWSAVGAGITAGSVNAIAVDGSHVWVGGTMTFAGPLGQQQLAVWDGTGWADIGTVFPINGAVSAMAIVGRTLYIGGSFVNAFGLPSADYIVAVNLDTGSYSALAPNDGDINGTVSSITPDGAGGIWVGGSFINADQVAAADRIAHYRDGVWSSLGHNGALDGAITATVRGIAATSTDVYAVGDFTDVAGTGQADHVARYNIASDTWFEVGPPGFFTASDVPLYSVAVDGSRVFVGGTMINGGGMAKLDGIAAFTGKTWKNVGTSADGTNGPASGSIRALWIGGWEALRGRARLGDRGRQPERLCGLVPRAAARCGGRARCRRIRRGRRLRHLDAEKVDRDTSGHEDDVPAPLPERRLHLRPLPRQGSGQRRRVHGDLPRWGQECHSAGGRRDVFHGRARAGRDQDPPAPRCGPRVCGDRGVALVDRQAVNRWRGGTLRPCDGDRDRQLTSGEAHHARPSPAVMTIHTRPSPSAEVSRSVTSTA